MGISKRFPITEQDIERLAVSPALWEDLGLVPPAVGRCAACGCPMVAGAEAVCKGPLDKPVVFCSWRCAYGNGGAS